MGKFSLSSLLPIGAAALIGFQNCSPVGFDTDPLNSKLGDPAIIEPTAGSGTITINGGAAFTSDISVRVQAQTERAQEMYLTNDPTCETGGLWEPLRHDRRWLLGQSNSEAKVFGKFRTSEGLVTDCTQASIVHDDIAPIVEITLAPAPLQKDRDARHEFRGEDAGSGIESFQCLFAGGEWKNCAPPHELLALNEGRHRFLVRAVDRAGNISEAKDSNWLIDRTPPVIAFTEVPPPLSNSGSALFRFEADDDGAGIENLLCAFDTAAGPGVFEACMSPYVRNGLGDSMNPLSYRLIVRAIDSVGNQSEISYDFNVDQVPPHDFIIRGITGGSDTSTDEWLGTVRTPTVHWTPSEGAESYLVSIWDTTGQELICAESYAAPSATERAMPSGCILDDGESYEARVIALRGPGNRREVRKDFTVDVTPPMIEIIKHILSNDDRDSEFKFAITDSVSGVKSARCLQEKTGSTEATEKSDVNCLNLDSITYQNLTYGPHSFQITASDRAGNQAMSELRKWDVNKIVCNPFSGSDELCPKGLKGNLYYLSKEHVAQIGASNANKYNWIDYIEKGIRAPITIFMSHLALPIRSFTSGFLATDGTYIADANGERLTEYFALDLETVLKLDGVNNSAGRYQLAILSDDGSIIEIKNSPTDPWRKVIDNDGTHSTRIGCNLDGIDLTADSRIAMRIKYFQGPREHIALKMLWRILPENQAAAQESECGASRGNDYFYGPDYSKPDLTNKYGYGKLLDRGWKVIQPENFVSIDEK